METKYNIGNYYGRLKTKVEDGKFFWTIEDWNGDDWVEISEDLYKALDQHGDKRL